LELDESRGAFLADRYQRDNAQSAAELLGCSGLQWIVLLSHQCYPTGLYRLDNGQCDSVPFGCTKFEGKFRLVSAFTHQSLDVITAGRSHRPEILLDSAQTYPCYKALELDISRGAIIVTGNCCPGDGILMHVMLKGEILCSPKFAICL
jgi:hypothetical protein